MSNPQTPQQPGRPAPAWRSLPELGEHEYPHWNRVYVAVILYTVAVILLLWAFQETMRY